jgi:hypothetical protein
MFTYLIYLNNLWVNIYNQGFQKKKLIEKYGPQG